MPGPAVVRAIDAIADGHMVLAVDDKDREDEADPIIAAEFATPKALTCMAHKGFDTRSSGATKRTYIVGPRTYQQPGRLTDKWERANCQSHQYLFCLHELITARPCIWS